jgi:hypothetical protein
LLMLLMLKVAIFMGADEMHAELCSKQAPSRQAAPIGAV